jgi:hypothetical protein
MKVRTASISSNTITTESAQVTSLVVVFVILLIVEMKMALLSRNLPLRKMAMRTQVLAFL